MEEIINFGTPHVGEHIFESNGTEDMLQYLKVSQTWQELAKTVLLKRWKGRMSEACKTGTTGIVKLLLPKCHR